MRERLVHMAETPACQTRSRKGALRATCAASRQVQRSPTGSLPAGPRHGMGKVVNSRAEFECASRQQSRPRHSTFGIASVCEDNSG
jgi:hypothetical protein